MTLPTALPEIEIVPDEVVVTSTSAVTWMRNGPTVALFVPSEAPISMLPEKPTLPTNERIAASNDRTACRSGRRLRHNRLAAAVWQLVALPMLPPAWRTGVGERGLRRSDMPLKTIHRFVERPRG